MQSKTTPAPTNKPPVAPAPVSRPAAAPVKKGNTVEYGAGMGGSAEGGGGAAVQSLPGANTPNGGLKAFSGTQKARTSGATPNSIYTYLSGDGTKAVSNYIYNSQGEVIFQVDFAKHQGFHSGHGHSMSIPGDFGSGHSGQHIPWNLIPSDYFKIPTGVQYSTPIGQ